MSAPFDIAELRANIGCDSDTERMLLSMFVETCSESLRQLKQRFPSADDAEYDQLWKTLMHQMKGAALNLGAADLSRIAASAQQQFEADLAVKRRLLADAEQAFAVVRDYISQLTSPASGGGNEASVSVGNR